ncbi:MAG: PilZ domain-containing protein [Omnitrophica bacterium]|nr:PilZ domain-containing protein [Candidatus Omnitrophota bacterium]
MWDGVDRRRFPRAEYPCLITMRRAAPSEQAILTHTENISVSGVRIISRKKLEVMMEVDLEIDLMDTLPTIAPKGMVMRVEEIPSGREDQSRHYDIGIRFITLPDEARRRVDSIVEHLLKKK